MTVQPPSVIPYAFGVRGEPALRMVNATMPLQPQLEIYGAKFKDPWRQVEIREVPSAAELRRARFPATHMPLPRPAASAAAATKQPVAAGDGSALSSKPGVASADPTVEVEVAGCCACLRRLYNKLDSRLRASVASAT